MNAKNKRNKNNGPKGTIVDRLTPDTATLIKDRIMERFADHVLAVIKRTSNDSDNHPTNKNDESKSHKESFCVILDDADSKKLEKQELQEKIDIILKDLVKAMTGPEGTPIECTSVLTSTITQDCKDGSYHRLQDLISSTTIHDTGIMEALKSMWLHKELVLHKLEKYVVAYVIAGSIVKGVANPKSDIDSYVIVDDTDVKRMSRTELQEKLRGIIYSLARDVESETGVKRRIHPQIWLLTEYWENLKEANPVTMTMLRDCMPIYDRGIFMPWKNLLDMGRIKPSAEAIDMYMDSGEQMYRRVNERLLDIVMEDLCLGLLYPSQALVMLAGEQPPAPKNAVDKMRELFVDKTKILEEKDIDILARAIKMRKAIEYGEIKEIDGTRLQEMLTDGKIYLEKIKDAFRIVEENKDTEENMTKNMEENQNKEDKKKDGSISVNKKNEAAV